MEFKDQLKELRKKNNMTQSGLSKMLEVPKRTIENWEGGVNSPPEYVQKLILEKMRAE
ncbi:MAG: helix-turn-helix transcriptional regulator [Dialister sp.]|nr:helix-turn-helix transcriptional regulator [Dialister sp.]MDU5889011.1 helix-turn-helix transcriptional regulator [Dialister sp.]